MSPPHVLTLVGIPRHHEDPLDRLLVATALTEPDQRVTRDARLGAYEWMVTAD